MDERRGITPQFFHRGMANSQQRNNVIEMLHIDNLVCLKHNEIRDHIAHFMKVL